MTRAKGCRRALDVPLLFETNISRNISDIIMDYIPLDIQLERLMKRDNINKKEAMDRINAQVLVEKKGNSGFRY